MGMKDAVWFGKARDLTCTKLHKMTTPAAMCVVAEGMTDLSGMSLPSVMWDPNAGGQLIGKYAQHAVP